MEITKFLILKFHSSFQLPENNNQLFLAYVFKLTASCMVSLKIEKSGKEVLFYVMDVSLAKL